jgi:DNA-binding winged helix-turn-helix (wHTH) protein
MVDTENSEAEAALSFGPFRLFAAGRRVEKEGAPVQIGGRALDILIALAERAGETVGKRELIARVWPDVTVDEGSLRFHIAALRRALGDGEAGAKYISNVPGRGYCFVAAVSHVKRPETAPPETQVPVRPRGLPARLMRMVGRDETVRTISARLATDRFITIVGSGGIGKTTLAVAIGHEVSAAYGGAVHFVELGALRARQEIDESGFGFSGFPSGYLYHM